MRRRRLVVLGLAALAAGVAGCDKLKRDKFELIRVRQDAQADVERLIGPPDYKLPGMWHYERQDQHLVVRVDFDPAGVVIRKQWIDALRATWEDSDARQEPGAAPEAVDPHHLGADE